MFYLTLHHLFCWSPFYSANNSAVPCSQWDRGTLLYKCLHVVLFKIELLLLRVSVAFYYFRALAAVYMYFEKNKISTYFNKYLLNFQGAKCTRSSK